MKVRALRQGDVEIDGVLKALFEGQVYDLPESLAADWLEVLPEEPEAKAVESPPRDKAVRPQRNKAL